MKKFTLFFAFIACTLAGYAQSAIVGNYTGDINLTHLQGEGSVLEAQTVTIVENENGGIDVVFPSFTTMVGMPTGEILVQDITVTEGADGSYELSKAQFTIAAGMVTFPYCTFSGTVYSDGAVEAIVEVIQNPELGALTTAYFFAEPAGAGDFSAVLGDYAGGISISHLQGEGSALEEQTVTVAQNEEGGIDVVFPTFTTMLGMATGEILVPNVSVVDNGDGSYILSKDLFTISTGMVSFPNSTFAGVIGADGSAEMTIEVIQNPAMGALTTAKFSTAGVSGDEPGGDTDPTEFTWGTATWNTADNVVYDGIEAFEAAGLTLSYPNPSGFAFGPFHMMVVEFDLFVDNSTEPVKASSSARSSADVMIEYPFVEGHSYKIVTTCALLGQANLSTYSTDTVAINTEDSYSISFTINGPELQKTIDVEGWMSLAITNQDYTRTISTVDVADICATLGISDISEAAMHPIRPNDSYCDHMDYFDWWRDADGDFTPYNAGYNNIFGHNAYPAVYCIKVNETADTVSYYFYDYWTIIDPEAGDNAGGGTIVTRAPETVYSSDTVEWENEDGTITYYRRSWRVVEGEDYVSEVMYVANGKSVILRATLHFVTEEEWNEKTAITEAKAEATGITEYFSISGARLNALQQGINIVRYPDGTVRKVFVK